MKGTLEVFLKSVGFALGKRRKVHTCVHNHLLCVYVSLISPCCWLYHFSLYFSPRHGMFVKSLKKKTKIHFDEESHFGCGASSNNA